MLGSSSQWAGRQPRAETMSSRGTTFITKLNPTDRESVLISPSVELYFHLPVGLLNFVCLSTSSLFCIFVYFVVL